MNDKKLLMAKAMSFTNSIRAMKPDEKKDNPSGKFGEDYNRLRSLVAHGFPKLEPLLPPLVDTYQAIDDNRYTTQKFSEIDTFCEQIFQLLSALEE